MDFLDRYEMADRRISEADPFQLNEVRGKLFKVPRAKYVEAVKISDIKRDCPGVSRDMVRLVLRELTAEGAIAPTGRGRSAKWSPQGEGPHHG